MVTKLSLDPIAAGRLCRQTAAAALAEPAAFAAALSATGPHAVMVTAPVLPFVSGSAYFRFDDPDGHMRKPSGSAKLSLEP